MKALEKRTGRDLNGVRAFLSKKQLWYGENNESMYFYDGGGVHGIGYVWCASG